MADLACGTDVTNVLANGDRSELRFTLLHTHFRREFSESLSVCLTTVLIYCWAPYYLVLLPISTSSPLRASHWLNSSTPRRLITPKGVEQAFIYPDGSPDKCRTLRWPQTQHDPVLMRGRKHSNVMTISIRQALGTSGAVP